MFSRPPTLTIPRLITRGRQCTGKAPAACQLCAASLPHRKMRCRKSLNDPRDRIRRDVIRAQPVNDLELLRRKVVPRYVLGVRKGRDRICQSRCVGRGYVRVDIDDGRPRPTEWMKADRAPSRLDGPRALDWLRRGSDPGRKHVPENCRTGERGNGRIRSRLSGEERPPR